MKLHVALIVFSLIGSGFSQEPKLSDGDPTVMATRKLLKVFGGTWSITETYDPSASRPHGGTGSGEEIWRAGPGERSMIEEYRSTDDTGTTLTGFGLGWWEEESRGFRLNWCSSRHDCARLSEVAKWEGDSWVIKDSRGEEFQFKEVFSDLTPNSFTQTLYQGPTGNLKRIATIKAVRVK